MQESDEVREAFETTVFAIGLRMIALVGQMNGYGTGHIEHFVRTFISPQKSEGDCHERAVINLEQWLLWMSSTSEMKKEQYQQGTYPEEFVMFCNRYRVNRFAEAIDAAMKKTKAEEAQ